MKLFNNNKKRCIHNSLQTLFVSVSILTVPAYTIFLGTKKSPFKYTLSNIANLFDYNTSFIVWGIVTGTCFLVYLLWTFTKLDYKNKRARGYLIASNVFLLLTVTTPAIKDVMPLLHFMHVICSVLFALFLILSIMLFIQYFSIRDRWLGKIAFTLFLATVAIPMFTLFFMGLNGVVEILFFVCISIFLIILNVILNFVEQRIPIRPRKSNDSKDSSSNKSNIA